MNIRKGDLVEVIAGKKADKKKQGKVLKVLTKKNRVIVEGVNMITKHLKPSTMNPDGGIQTIEGSIHASNVMIVDPETKKPTRVGIEFKDGKKVRVTKKSGTELDK